jgi:hypothetical protein
MKITRSSTTSATATSAEKSKKTDGCPEWDAARKHIKEAIDELTGPASKGCDISKDAIANLSVVLFDLK